MRSTWGVRVFAQNEEAASERRRQRRLSQDPSSPVQHEEARRLPVPSLRCQRSGRHAVPVSEISGLLCVSGAGAALKFRGCCARLVPARRNHFRAA